MAFVLKVEGKYSDVPGDHGGATNYGVTQAVYDAYCIGNHQGPRPVREITHDEIVEIYRVGYWNPTQCRVLPPALALCVFDAAVLHGPKRAAMMLQECVGTVPDGSIGPKTLAELMTLSLRQVVVRYLSIRYNVLMSLSRKPQQEQFRQGWINRLLALKRKSIEILDR